MVLSAAAPAAVSWAALAVSLSSLAVALVRFLWERPKLAIDRVPESAADAASYHDDVRSDTTRFVRARVCNKSKFVTARNVQVLAYTVGDRDREYQGLDIRPLRWGSAEGPDEVVVRVDIPPKAERHVDLVEADAGHSGEELDAHVRVGRRPRLEGDRLPSGQNRLFLLATCDDMRSKAFCIDVKIDGTGLDALCAGRVMPRTRGGR